MEPTRNPRGVRFNFPDRLMGVHDPEQVEFPGQRQPITVVRQRGRRRDIHLDLAPDDIVLDAWDVPFRTDTEAGGVMAGNACYNLIGEHEAIRPCIEGRAVWPVSDDAKAKVIVTESARSTCDDEGLALLYPEIDTHHAVVNRLKAK